MPFPVNFLIVGEGNPEYEKGAVISAQSQGFGDLEVTPGFVQLTVTDFPGSTQMEAVQTALQYMGRWADHFSVIEVNGAGFGRQRYRVEATPEVANDLGAQTKVKMRDTILNWMQGFDPSAEVTDQGSTFAEYESIQGIPTEEIKNELTGAVNFSRYVFPASLVDAALATVNPNEPVHFNRTFDQVKPGAPQGVIDKLKQ